MICSKCGEGTRVLETRRTQENGQHGIRRRRVCTCGHVFTTYEVTASDAARAGYMKLKPHLQSIHAALQEIETVGRTGSNMVTWGEVRKDWS